MDDNVHHGCTKKKSKHLKWVICIENVWILPRIECDGYGLTESISDCGNIF